MPTPSGTHRLALWCHDMATLFSQGGQYDRAEEWALRGLQVRARNLNSRNYAELALARLNLGNFTGAEEAARRGLESEPNAYPLHLYRGMALERLGRADEALAEMESAFEASGDPRIRLNIGQALATLGRYEEAVAELDQVPAGIPERAAARRDMAVLFLNRLGRPDLGLAALREAAALTTNPGEAALLREEVARLERMGAGAVRGGPGAGRAGTGAR
jgi:tetratricopeptide (TPR) repeat protein